MSDDGLAVDAVVLPAVCLPLCLLFTVYVHYCSRARGLLRFLWTHLEAWGGAQIKLGGGGTPVQTLREFQRGARSIGTAVTLALVLMLTTVVRNPICFASGVRSSAARCSSQELLDALQKLSLMLVLVVATACFLFSTRYSTRLAISVNASTDPRHLHLGKFMLQQLRLAFETQVLGWRATVYAMLLGAWIMSHWALVPATVAYCAMLYWTELVGLPPEHLHEHEPVFDDDDGDETTDRHRDIVR